MLKRTMVSLALCGLLTAGVVAEEKRGPNEGFYHVQQKLDTGGTFYFYTDLEGAIQMAKDQFYPLMELTAAQEGSAAEIQMVKAGIDAVVDGLRLESITDVGVSAIPDGELSRIRFYVHAPGMDTGFRSFLGGAPHKRKTLNLAPDSTVVFYSNDLSAKQLYNFVAATVEKVGGAMGKAQLEQGLAQAEAESGIAFQKVFASLEGEMTFILSLDPTRTVDLPGGPQGTMKVPYGSILVALQSGDSSLYDGLLASFAKDGVPTQPATIADGVKATEIMVPPMPIPARPTIAQDGGFFYFTTDPDILKDGIARMASGSGGLGDNAEFKEMTSGFAMENNGATFVSVRLSNAIADLVENSGADAQTRMGVSMWQGLLSKSASVRVNEPEGILWTSRNTNTGMQMTSGMMVAPMGILAAIAVPGFLKARETSRVNACTENLYKIDGAKQQWALENNKSETDCPAAAELIGETLYIRMQPACPAGGEYAIGCMGEEPTCSIHGGMPAWE